jgi:hypothetical protein
MVTRILYGERETFAVEFARAESPHYIHVRQWVAGHWVGDIEDSLMPEFMCARLLALACPLRYPKYAYDSEEDGPTYEALLDRGGMSFGESFDPFALAYYSVRKSNRIHFKWRLHEAYYPLFPDYPRREYHCSVAIPNFRLVVKAFITAMIDEGYYVLRPGLPTLAELECQGSEP